MRLQMRMSPTWSMQSAPRQKALICSITGVRSNDPAVKFTADRYEQQRGLIGRRDAFAAVAHFPLFGAIVSVRCGNVEAALAPVPI